MRIFTEAVTPISYEYQGFWGSFWDLIWWFLAIFIFFAYLMVLFSIITDLFRDHKLSGWWKAVWIIVLLLTNWLGALIYLIVRGRGMGERSAAQAQAFERAQQDYIKQAAGTSPADEIAKAKSLLDAGTITQAEYDQIKSKALS
ncbi:MULTISPECIES: SHOCT domain-containing protein [unclassified Microbacterium]|uniref:SHOCT domain-containing protein n=1 Tax=unclassified Microbacterium TaxID=2609290 RepID=UPI001E4BC4E5|nr:MULTISPECIES: SHOCT domain-containing protein [unclassified Microbacterium]